MADFNIHNISSVLFAEIFHQTPRYISKWDNGTVDILEYLLLLSRFSTFNSFLAIVCRFQYTWYWYQHNKVHHGASLTIFNSDFHGLLLAHFSMFSLLCALDRYSLTFLADRVLLEESLLLVRTAVVRKIKPKCLHFLLNISDVHVLKQLQLVRTFTEGLT